MVLGIIDKHPILRTGLSVVFSDHFPEACTFSAEDVSDFYNLVTKSPHVIIVGRVDKSYELLDTINTIRVLFPKSEVIIFDETPRFLRVTEFFSKGIKGYITRASSESELVECIKEVLGGNWYVSQDNESHC